MTIDQVVNQRISARLGQLEARVIQLEVYCDHLEAENKKLKEEQEGKENGPST